MDIIENNSSDLLANKSDSTWDYLFVELADPRTNDWPLIRSPVPTFIILCAYWYFVLYWGPRYMKDRKPFNLERVLIAYNFVQVLVSIWLVHEGLDAAWFRHYNWRCQNVDRSWTPQAFREARGVYVYYLAKISELLDTVFFILRKRDRQVTFLHVYHHSVMPMISWGTTKYYPGGHGTFIGTLNSFVHIIMYSYYLLSAMGPWIQPYLWWKKHITNLQLIQFCMAFCHSSQLLWEDCGYPRWSVIFTLPNAIFFYYLFNDFYTKAYKSSQKAKADAAAKAAQAAAEITNNNNNDNNNNNENDNNNNSKTKNQNEIKKEL